VYELLAIGVLVYFIALAWIFRDRPLTDDDRQCAAIDEDLDRQARADERRARSDLYGGSGFRGR
jgi:hypothetical protein